MPTRRRLILAGAGAALLIGAAWLVLHLMAGRGGSVPSLERPHPAAPEASARQELQVESDSVRASAAPAADVPPPAGQPPEDLRAEGGRRGWQLPIGKGWWTDALINPTGVDPEGRMLEALQERVLGWCDQMLDLEQRREQRLTACCQERIAAGLAVEDNGHEFPSDGREHKWITVHTLADPNRTLRVDIGPGDDAGLDELDRQIASTWCEAVIDLRRRFATLRR
jgi:hypothetical protein